MVGDPSTVRFHPVGLTCQNVVESMINFRLDVDKRVHANFGLGECTSEHKGPSV